jgi:nucleotide-binding universal stress UspA family protein
MRRVLVATDNSDSACRAVDAAAELAKATGALLIIVNVEQGYFDHAIGPQDVRDDIGSILEARSREILLRAK